MTEEDRERWDAKWHSFTGESFKPHTLLTGHRELLTGIGKALDLACGRGQNTIWLASLGYSVLGVDISPVALSTAQTEAGKLDLGERVKFMQVDLDSWVPPRDVYDLICVIRFLDRRLFPALRNALKPGGLLFYATRHRGIISSIPDANPAYLLEPDELRAVFADWRIHHYLEGSFEVELIAEKPATSQ